MDLADKARALRLLLFDVDGVLTDGTILLHADGSESKQFHIRDGTAIVWAHKAGLTTGVLSARHAGSTAQRAAQLSMPIVLQGVDNKLAAYERLLAEHALTDEQVAFMGDDLLDLPVLNRVGLSAAPADAVEAVRARVDWVADSRGGHGAVREFIEFVLEAQECWDTIVEPYVEGADR